MLFFLARALGLGLLWCFLIFNITLADSFNILSMSDEYCCDVTWDQGCVDLYEYCQDGWSGPTDLIEFRNELITYPNPTSDYIYVNKKVDITVVNMLGNIIISKKQINVLDVSVLTPGVYNLIIEHNKIKTNKKIIKK